MKVKSTRASQLFPFLRMYKPWIAMERERDQQSYYS